MRREGRLPGRRQPRLWTLAVPKISCWAIGRPMKFSGKIGGLALAWSSRSSWDAAEIAGMSRSTFHLHFKSITTMSPIEFRSHLRTQEARRLMVASAMDAASAGFAVG